MRDGKHNRILTLQASLTFAIGMLLITHPLLRFVGRFFKVEHTPVTMIPHIDLGLLSTVIGVLLIYNSFYLYKGMRAAFIACVAFTTLSLMIIIAQRHTSVIFVGLLSLLLLWLFYSYKLYSVKSDLVRIKLGIRISACIAVVGIAYGIIGFYYIGPIYFQHSSTFFEAITTSFRILFTLNDSVPFGTPALERFVDSLNIIGLAIYTVSLASLFKPVRFAFGTSSHDRQRAEAVIRASATTSEDYFKLWPQDKRYFFSQSGQSLIAYKCAGRTAIILADPSGRPDEFNQLMDDFLDFIQVNGWLCAAWGVGDNCKFLYESKRFKTLFIGNEAVIDIPKHVRHTIKSKHFRYVVNKAQKQGLVMELWDSFDATRLQQLRTVSESWLSRKGRREYGFFMSSFDEAYLRQGTVAVLKQAGSVIAYINLVPSLTQHDASIDQFRSMSGAPSVAMHYLLSELLVRLQQQNTKLLNIGLSPLSGLTRLDDPSVNERLLKIVKRLTRRYYSFSGVEQFKGKFQPTWQPLYLCYRGSSASLITIARDIEQASRA